MTASLAAELSRIAGQAFAAEGLSENFGIVQPSDRPDLAQYQCNGALAAARAAKANPRAIAEKIAARLKADPLFAKVDLRSALDPQRYVGRAPEQVDRFVSEIIAPIRVRYSSELSGASSDELRV